jgi:transposase-like protein
LETPLFDKEKDIGSLYDHQESSNSRLTYQLFQNGKTVAEIAKERGLVNSTIFGHLSKYAEQNLLDRNDLLRIYPKVKLKLSKNNSKLSQKKILTIGNLSCLQILIMEKSIDLELFLNLKK